MVYNLFLASLYCQDMSQSCRAKLEVPQAGRSPAGGQWIWSPSCGAEAHTGWMLVFSKIFFTIMIILRRSHSYKAFPKHYNH